VDDNELKSAYPILSTAIKFKDDTRSFKGYWFEIFIAKPKIEAIPNITYQCNPSNYEDWKSENQKNKYDGIVTLPNGKKITIEFKRRDCPKVYHSWFMDCWITREADWIVTNNTQCISYSDRRLLEKNGKKLLSLSEAIVEISRLVRNILHPRKYSIYFNRLIHSKLSQLSILVIRKGIICSKVRLKSCLLEVKSLLSARFPKSHLNSFLLIVTAIHHKIYRDN
jgi:hypothetical protein